MQKNKKFEDELDIVELLLLFWRGKYFIIICSMISLTAGSVYLRNVEPEYKVSILLAPAQEEQAEINFGGLNNLASLAGVTLPSSSASDFTKYKIMLTTEEISTLVFEDKSLIQDLFSGEWDNTQQIFRKPRQNRTGLLKNYVKKTLIGRESKKYTGPSPARLAEIIGTSISIDLDNKTGYLHLSTETAQPKLLIKLLSSLVRNTDELFKKKFIKRADDSIKFYQIKISKARSQEHREILAKLIAKEERTLLLATRDGPFVAEILSGPNISLYPTVPRVKLTLAVSLVFGLFLSIIIIVFRAFVLRDRND